MSKNKVEVMIGGQVYALQGNESEAHIQKVAQILDQKVGEMQQDSLAKHLNQSQKYFMMALNIADEYLKLEEERDLYSQELAKCNEENLALTERIKEMALEINQLKINKS